MTDAVTPQENQTTNIKGKAKRFFGFGLRGINLPLVGGSLLAWCTNPTFVGWAGAGKSFLVGVGTSVATGLGFVVGMFGGALAGATVGGLMFRRKEAVIIGGVVGGIGGFFVGGVAGTVIGYNKTENWLLEKDRNNTKTVFNENAGKPVSFDAVTTYVYKPSFQPRSL